MRFQLFLYTIFVLSDSSYCQVHDIDGNTYKTVQIGNQIWMAENLKVTHLNDGLLIPNVKDSLTWDTYTKPAYCFFNNSSSSNTGALYNFYSVETKKLCPVGWHVPNNSDWNTLLNTIGGGEKAGEILKSEFGWDHESMALCTSENGKDLMDFNILRSGVRGSKGQFINTGASFWTSDQSTYYFFCTETMLLNSYLPEKGGYSIRCLKDNIQHQNNSNLLNDLEHMFVLSSGELFKYLQDNLKLKNQKYISDTQVKYSNEYGYTFEFNFTDGSLQELKDVSIYSTDKVLFVSVKDELNKYVGKSKLTLEESIVHYQNDNFRYIISEIESGSNLVYLIFISKR